MHPTPRSALNTALTILLVVVVAALFFFKARQNYLHQDYVNANFFSFWLSGRMVWTGESPYDTTQWLQGFDEFAATYRPSQILQYPLPLMFFMAPVGLLPVGQAYFTWQLITLGVMAFSVVVLLRRQPPRKLLFLSLVIFLLFFGPAYLTLEIGSIGAISLLALTLAILFLETRRPLLAGIALSLTMLKPPQGLPLLLLVGVWLLASRQWKAISGVLVGGLILLLIWVVRDPLWLVKFQGSSGFLLGHTLGVQSNVFGFAYLACGRNESCMWIAGCASLFVVMALGAWYLWANRGRLSAWEALNIIIPVAFISALYLWSYDQLLYVIPIVWIANVLLERTRSYVAVFVFLVVLDLVSFAALAVEAFTHTDLLSLSTTLLVLGMCLWLLHRRNSPAPSLGAASSAATPT